MKTIKLPIALLFLALLPAWLMAFTISGPASGTIGFTGTYTVPALAGCDTYWVITGGTIVSPSSCSGGTTCTTTGQTITVKWNCSTTGTHRIDASRPGLLCTGTGTLNVTLTSVTMTPGTISGVATSCPNVNQTYSIASVPNAHSYNWTFPSGGGNIISGQGTTSVTVQWTNPGGSRSIRVTPQHNGCSGATSSTKTVTVTSLITATTGAITGASPVCQGATGQVYSITAVANATTYNWTVPSGASITAGAGTTSITVTYGTSAVSGNVTVTPANSCGSGTTSTKAITVNNLPSAAGAITGPTSICIGGGNAPYSIAAVAGATSYTWSASGGTIVSGAGTTAVTVNWTTAGARTLTVTPTNSCGNGTAANLTVRVYATPPAHVDTLSLAHAQFASATVQSLIIDHCQDNHPCAPQALFSSKVYFKFSTGNDYEYGTNPFSTSLTLNLTARDAYTGGTAVQSTAQALSLSQAAPEQWYVWDITSNYAAIHRVDIQFTGYTASALVQGTVQMKVYNEQQFLAAAAGQSVTLYAVNTAPSGISKLTFSWATTCGAFPNYEFQLLRLFNTDVDKAELANPANVTVKVDWDKATSIITQGSATSLQLTMAEGTGYYVWRVRPIGTLHPGGASNDLNWGNWSSTGAFTQGATVALTAGVSPHCFFYTQHEASKNWAYSRFHSDADAQSPKVKLKETMAYANGITQGRQAQTLLSSSGQMLVSQQFYDYNGRSSIAVQGVPVAQNSFGYISQLVQQTAGNLYGPEDFDAPANAHNPLPITAGPVASYWSSANADVSIPDAQGYPFARTYYYGDGTGRLMSANIPGIAHRYTGSVAGNTKATRVFYAGVSEAEVLSIFGDEAPRASRMRKLITVDADGVAQVAYLNSAGQTLATCLSATPAGGPLTPLDEAHNTFTVTDLVEGGTRMSDGSLVTTKPVAFTQPTNLKVLYNLTPKSVASACGSFCASCDYKLYFILHNLSDPAAVGFPKVDSLIVPGGSCPAMATGLTPFIQYTGLPAGSYRVEKRLFTGTVNPATGRSYAEEATAAFRTELYDKVEPLLTGMEAFQASGNLAGLNAYLSAHPELEMDMSGDFFTYTGDCFDLRIPYASCNAPDCGALNFEQMLTQKWSADATLGLGASIGNYFPASYAVVSGNFNALVANMLADPEYGYTCTQLHDCWLAIVDGYKDSHLAYGAMGLTYDPLDAFLDCTGRHLERESSTRITTSYASPGWFSHAYLALNAALTQATCISAVNTASADLSVGLSYPYADTAHWHWEMLLECNTAYAPDSAGAYNAANMANALEQDCRDLCDARYPGFVESLLAEYRADSRYVIAGEGTPGPGQTTITLEQIHCNAAQLVAQCKLGCELTLSTSSVPVPHVTDVGTPAEIAAMQASMTHSYAIALPPTGGSCGAGYITVGGSGNQPALLVSHLNTRLEEFRASMGVGTAQMNLYALIQEFDPSLISGTTCFTPATSVTVSSTQVSYFHEKDCSLSYKQPSGTDVVLCSGICASMSCPQVCFQWVSPVVYPVDTSLVFEMQLVTCEQQAVNHVLAETRSQLGTLLDNAAAAYRQKYLDECADPGSSESYRLEFGIDQYHYTLSYFDRAGNLLRTVPPGGVAFLDPNLTTVKNRQVATSHTLASSYEYNSLGQAIRTNAPDQGTRTITYNRLGQVRFTQQDQQLGLNAYTYVKYDALGRPIEDGQSTLSGAGGAFKAQAEVTSFPASGTERTLTQYTTTSGVSYSGSKPQRYLLNMPAMTLTDEDGNLATTTDQVKTHMSYTPQRYVEWVIQELPELGQNTILYDIDPGDGQLRKVCYNEGRVDQFFHRYTYDADNRMTMAETSSDGMIWEREQRIEFFPHGSVKRSLLGEDQVQGIDFTYTLNGQLKAINHPSLLGADDPGADGITGSHAKVAKDAFGMMLNYHTEDFRHGSGSLTAHASNPWFTTSHDYFAGKIGGWVNNTQAVGGLQLEQATAWKYEYDQDGRLLEALLHKQVSGVFTSMQDYRCNYLYDPNGNLLQTARNGYAALGLIMDGIDYHYLPGSNKLGHVTDVTFTSAYNNDIESQSPGNFSYDLAGRLTNDVSGKRSITWTHTDKVKNVFLDETGTANDANMSLLYDAGGHRVVKKNVLTSGTHMKTLFYVNDAAGQTMAVYEKEIIGDTSYYRRIEAALYAGGRVGQYGKTVTVKKVKGATVVTPALPAANGKYARLVGDRQYELRDHLTNVRATVSDTKQPINVSNLSLGFTAQVGMVANYDPFGAEMPGRMYAASNYRLGFNGQEKDEEVYGNGNSYTAEYWQYDSRLGRRWNCDPVVNPSESPYAAFRNCPVSYTDVKGDRPKKQKGNAANNTKSSPPHCDELDPNCSNQQMVSMSQVGGFFRRILGIPPQNPAPPSAPARSFSGIGIPIFSSNNGFGITGLNAIDDGPEIANYWATYVPGIALPQVTAVHPNVVTWYQLTNTSNIEAAINDACQYEQYGYPGMVVIGFVGVGLFAGQNQVDLDFMYTVHGLTQFPCWRLNPGQAMDAAEVAAFVQDKFNAVTQPIPQLMPMMATEPNPFLAGGGGMPAAPTGFSSLPSLTPPMFGIDFASALSVGPKIVSGATAGFNYAVQFAEQAAATVQVLGQGLGAAVTAPIAPLLVAPSLLEPPPGQFGRPPQIEMY